MLGWANRSSALWLLGSCFVDALRFLLDDVVECVFAMSATGVLQARGVDAILGRAPVLAGAQDGIAMTRTLAAVEDSARTGLPADVRT